MTAAHPYWPMLPGSVSKFARYSVVGGWNPSTMAIWINSPQSQFLNGEEFEYSYRATPVGITWSELHHPVGSTTGPTFQRMAGVLGDKYFLGEGINDIGNFIYPPEPFITQYPIAGETLDAYSVVRKSDSDPTVVIPAYHSKYKTLAHYDVWGNLPWADCWQTALLEYGPSGPTNIYNFVFARDIGLVNVKIGFIGANNAITGFELYMATYTEPPS